MKKIRLYCIGLCLLSTQWGKAQMVSPVEYVDPFIGVLDELSNCVIGPQMPFGSINPSPHTPNGSYDGYDPKDEISGFGQLHVSGVGWGKYGQVFVSPQIGLAIGDNDHDSPKSREKARAYEYSVHLDRYKIRVDVTPSHHSAIYRFVYPQSDDAYVIFDLSHHIAKQIEPKLGGRFMEGSLQITGQHNNTLEGYGYYAGGFGGSHKVYFSLCLDKAPLAVGTWYNGTLHFGRKQETVKKQDDRMGVFFKYSTQDKEEIYLKVGVSLKSISQAKYWLEQEIPDFDYEKVKSCAVDTWNRELSKIQIAGASDRDKRLFYTAFYHTYVMPRNRTNDMLGFGKDVPVWDDHFATWDTWRTLFPLHSLINPHMVAGTVNSYIARLGLNGMVKDAYIAGTEMLQEQGGNDIDNIIADAYVKGVKGIDWAQAYGVLKHNADHERLGSFAWDKNDRTNMYKEQGWIAAGRMSNSMTQEYAYNDFCAAQLAKKYGTKFDYRKYLERSQKWVALWNPEAESDGFKGFIMPRNADGTFVDYDAKQYPGSWKNYFYEGSSWTYSFFAPHQFEKLVALSGGKELFGKRLKHGLDKGYINYGNEPAFLAVQCFHYADRSDLASYYIRKLMKERFNELGYSGNDDSGAMSSWYMFANMGFFPNAGQDIYYVTGSRFSSIKIQLPEGGSIDISAPNASEENIYVKSVSINGRKLKQSWFRHKDIQNGAKIVFEMTNKPINHTNM